MVDDDNQTSNRKANNPMFDLTATERRHTATQLAVTLVPLDTILDRLVTTWIRHHEQARNEVDDTRLSGITVAIAGVVDQNPGDVHELLVDSYGHHILELIAGQRDELTRHLVLRLGAAFPVTSNLEETA